MVLTAIPSSQASDGKADSYTVPLLIGGKESRTAKTFSVTSPATGDAIHQCSAATETEALDAVSAAGAALGNWRTVLPAVRRDIFMKTADILDSRRAELMQIMSEETGAADAWAQFNINTTIEQIKDIAGRVSSIVGHVPTTSDPNYEAMVVSEPYGVVFAIAPW